jgi:O-antigen ligase
MFAPIHMLRSVLDSRTDSSSLWRDMENFNLFVTVRSNPVFGTGFGHGYIESIRLPDISEGFELWRYQPHNSILGLLAFAGILGFAAIWLIIPLGIFFGIRNYRLSQSAQDRTLALSSVCVIISYVVHCYGDMGLGTWTSVFTVGPALALIGKQAVATGAWPLQRRHGLEDGGAEHPAQA